MLNSARYPSERSGTVTFDVQDLGGNLLELHSVTYTFAVPLIVAGALRRRRRSIS